MKTTLTLLAFLFLMAACKKEKINTSSVPERSASEFSVYKSGSNATIVNNGANTSIVYFKINWIKSSSNYVEYSGTKNYQQNQINLLAGDTFKLALIGITGQTSSSTDEVFLNANMDSIINFSFLIFDHYYDLNGRQTISSVECKWKQ